MNLPVMDPDSRNRGRIAEILPPLCHCERFQKYCLKLLPGGDKWRQVVEFVGVLYKIYRLFHQNFFTIMMTSKVL